MRMPLSRLGDGAYKVLTHLLAHMGHEIRDWQPLTNGTGMCCA